MRQGVLLLVMDVCSKLRVRKRRKRPNLNMLSSIFGIHFI